MAILVSLSVSPSAPATGQTITATYAVTGNTGTPKGPDVSGHIDGKVTLGTDVLDVTTNITLPGTPAVPPLSESFSAPVLNGRTFSATADPKVWTLVL